MKLYADEAVDRQIVESLRSAGLDVFYAAETDAAVIDEVVLQKATAESRGVARLVKTVLTVF